MNTVIMKSGKSKVMYHWINDNRKPTHRPLAIFIGDCDGETVSGTLPNDCYYMFHSTIDQAKNMFKKESSERFNPIVVYTNKPMSNQIDSAKKFDKESHAKCLFMFSEE